MLWRQFVLDFNSTVSLNCNNIIKATQANSYNVNSPHVPRHPCLPILPDKGLRLDHNIYLLKTSICETQPPASIGWVALSSVVVVCRRASVTSPLISFLWGFRAYKLYIFCEDMILATYQCQHIFCCWVEPSLLLSSFYRFSRGIENS